jgi:general secretion pathway protein C
MTLFIRKYFWTINLATISLCALLAAQALGHLVEANLPIAKSRATPPSIGIDHSMMMARSRDIKPLLARNIFCSTCEPAAEPADKGDSNGKGSNEPANNEPVKTSLSVRLVATLVSNEDKAWSFAAIEYTTEKKTGLYSIGSKIPGEATVTDIMDHRVLLLNGNRNEYIDLEATSAPPSGPSSSSYGEEEMQRPRMSFNRPQMLPGLEDISKGIRKVGESRYEIQRATLNKVLGNTTLLARSARIVPSVQNGVPNGFKLFAIRPGSLYSMLGLMNGDTISAINGHPINTPDKALEVYTKLRNASHVSISFNRQGKTSTQEYTIR